MDPNHQHRSIRRHAGDLVRRRSHETGHGLPESGELLRVAAAGFSIAPKATIQLEIEEFRAAVSGIVIVAMKSAFLPLVFLSMGWPALAQFAPPNAAGVTLGQIHLIVKDVDAERRFFIDMMDGVPVENDKISMIQLPGVFVIISQGDPSGPSAGFT